MDELGGFEPTDTTGFIQIESIRIKKCVRRFYPPGQPLTMSSQMGPGEHSQGPGGRGAQGRVRHAPLSGRIHHCIIGPCNKVCPLDMRHRHHRRRRGITIVTQFLISVHICHEANIAIGGGGILRV